MPDCGRPSRVPTPHGVPSVYACYRFATKLRTYGDVLAACLDRVTAALHAEHPDMGTNVAIDGSDMPAYANGQRFLSKNGPERERYSDDAPRRARNPRKRTNMSRCQGPNCRTLVVGPFGISTPDPSPFSEDILRYRLRLRQR
jgi:hypothetical protein